MSRVAIVVGHPRSGTFCQALAENYAAGANRAGHRADVFLLSDARFDPILHEGFARPQPLEPDLQAIHDAILAADHLVLLFPLWLGGMPALMKGFLDRVFQPEMVSAMATKKFPRLLHHKSVRIIVTMGMPAAIYRWWFGGYEVKMLRRNILRSVGARPVRVTLMGGVDGSADKRRIYLHQAIELGSRIR